MVVILGQNWMVGVAVPAEGRVQCRLFSRPLDGGPGPVCADMMYRSNTGRYMLVG